VEIRGRSVGRRRWNTSEIVEVWGKGRMRKEMKARPVRERGQKRKM
jgi:hypothetical protein